MASIISSGTTSGTALNFSGDTSGVLQLATNGTTTALSISTAQVVTLTNALPVTSGGTGVTTSTGTGAVVLGTSPTITTPTINQFSSASATNLTIQSAGTTAVTIDTSQNVGIGVTPSATGSGKALEIGTVGNTLWGVGSADLQISAGTYYNGGNKYAVTGSAVSAYELVAGTHRWYYAASGTAGNTASFSESMRIDSSGRVCIGVNSAAYSTACAMNVNVDTVSSSGGAWVSKAASTSTAFHMNFQNGNGGVGGISTSGTTTAYVTTSDYRLKENIQPMQNALAIISQLKPVTYKWKTDGSDGQGFIAHELQEVVPDCVTGEKDAVDADGNPKYQGIDTSFLVATLTAALQETKALIDTQTETINALTARVVALESK